MINIGNIGITNLFLGSTQVSKVYLGSVQVWPTESNYVTFTAQQANSTIGLSKLSTNQTLEYSTDKVNWLTFDTSVTITLANVGDEVYIRGILNGDNTSSDYTQFTMTGLIAASGNCNTIWNYEDLNAPLKSRCGYYMFYGCSSLTTSPALPATTLTISCYQDMFARCANLISAPELPATTLASNCYAGMFYECTSLTTAPEVLPAMNIVFGCYANMFYGCSALTIAPELPATTLANSCYLYMFYNCVGLNYIKCLANDISAVSCTFGWVRAVSSTGTFVKNPSATSWTTGNSGIPTGWNVLDADNVLLFFGSGSDTYYIEHNIDLNGEYIKTKVQTYNLTATSYTDQFLALPDSEYANSVVGIKMLPNGNSQKGVKRNEYAMTKLDLSELPAQSLWYFWNHRTWNDLREIIFPKGAYRKAIVNFTGSFPHITIPNKCNAVFILDYPQKTNISFEDVKYDNMYLCVGDASGYELYKDSVPTTNYGICGYARNIDLLSEETKNLYISKGYKFKQIDSVWNYDIT